MYNRRKKHHSEDNGFGAWVKIYKYFRLGVTNYGCSTVAWNVLRKREGINVISGGPHLLLLFITQEYY
jgi:hypothetical protein